MAGPSIDVNVPSAPRPRGRKAVTVGILSPGEMGAAFGGLLRDHGFTVVTTLEGRSPRTREICQGAGLDVLDSMAEVVGASGIVFSLVSPAAAVDVADSFSRCASALGRAPLYVDANSISPLTVAEIGRRLTECRADFVDAAIQGLAGRLRDGGTIYLSGPRAGELAELLSGVVRLRCVGPEAGRASLLKMLTGGLAKGLAALFLELGLAAENAGLADDLLAVTALHYPGVQELALRLLPTFPQQAERRTTEMQEVERTLLHLGVLPEIMRGVRGFMARIAASHAAPGTPSALLDELIGSFVSHVSLRDITRPVAAQT